MIAVIMIALAIISSVLLTLLFYCAIKTLYVFVDALDETMDEVRVKEKIKEKMKQELKEKSDKYGDGKD